MPKDRSFAHRIHQSNIDRQRNADYFLSRHNVGQNQAPKADFWQRVKTAFEAPLPWILSGFLVSLLLIIGVRVVTQ